MTNKSTLTTRRLSREIHHEIQRSGRGKFPIFSFQCSLRGCHFFFPKVLRGFLFTDVPLLRGQRHVLCCSTCLSCRSAHGWNDWAHYQCNYTAQTIIENARALVKTGLAARGYNTVTIDDCWMEKSRDSQGDLQADQPDFPAA